MGEVRERNQYTGLLTVHSASSSAKPRAQKAQHNDDEEGDVDVNDVDRQRSVNPLSSEVHGM